MEEDLRVRLLAVAGIAALVGQRVSWFERPRTGGFPCLLLENVYNERGWTHQGPDGFDLARVQISCLAENNAQARQLAALVQTEMETVPWRDSGATRFHPAMLESRLRDTEDLNGAPIYRLLLDLEFNHQPTN